MSLSTLLSKKGACNLAKIAILVIFSLDFLFVLFSLLKLLLYLKVAWVFLLVFLNLVPFFLFITFTFLGLQGLLFHILLSEIGFHSDIWGVLILHVLLVLTRLVIIEHVLLVLFCRLPLTYSFLVLLSLHLGSVISCMGH